jgi:4-diphosphocytidyl-2C-methyl-D-erythritol kinase
MQTFSLSAPAKLNRFLHIVGQRGDGYHKLQTIFHLVDYCDTLYFTVRKDNKVNLVVRKDKDAVGKQITNLADKHNFSSCSVITTIKFTTLRRGYSVNQEDPNRRRFGRR